MSSSTKSPSSWHVLGTDLKRWSRDHAFAVACSLLFLIVNIVHLIWQAGRHIRTGGNLRNPSLSQVPFVGQPGLHQPWQIDLLTWISHVFGSLVFVRGIFMPIVYFALILIVLSVAQSKLGVWKSIGVALLSATFGLAIGLAVCYLVSHTMQGWMRLENIPVLLSPLTLLIGLLMAVSAFESVLWKRRIVLLGYTFVGTLLLFSGNPGDYCNLAAAVVGHVTGLLIHGRDGERMHWQRGSDYEIRRLFAFAQVVLAVGPVLSLTSTSHLGLLTNSGLLTSSLLAGSPFLTSCDTNTTLKSCILITGQHSVTLLGLWLHILLPVVALGIVAWGLYHGRRVAAWTSITVNAIAVVFAILYYLIIPLMPISGTSDAITWRYATMPAFVITALPSLLLIVFMARELAHFEIPTGTVRVRNGIISILVSLIVTSGLYALFVLSFPASFAPRPTPKILALDTLRRLLPLGFGGRKTVLIRPRTLAATLAGIGITTVFWLTMLIVFIFWFKDEVSPDERDRKRANTLVEHGGDSMSFMTTWDDNHYWFSSTGRSAVAYRVMHGIALSVTGPFGDRAEYNNDLREFSAFCDAKGWSPVFYSIHDGQRKELESRGFSSIQVGTEMVIDPNAWQTRGRKWQDIRTAINKAKRSGIVDVFSTYESAGFNVQQQIVDISEEWAQLKALPEMKFTLGGVEELRDPRVALLYAVDANGVVLGVTSWLPTYRDGKVIGWTLDFMRHRTGSPNGIMEFLIARMAERLRDQGAEDPDNAVEFMSLSAAPLAGMGEGREQATADGEEAQNTEESSQSGEEIIEHALQIVADILEPAYGFKSLFFFKRKFQPTPAPVYICYPDSSKLAQIAITVVSAYVPELKASQVVDILKTMTAKKDNTKAAK